MAEEKQIIEDMAYIDANELFKCETCRHCIDGKCNTFCDSGECYSPNMFKMPTADVVPKSEVDWHREAELNAQRIIELEAEVERLKKDNEYILMQHRFQRRPSGDCWNDGIEKAKTEVAREIFEEIEKKIVVDRLCSCEGIMTIDVDTERYAELKKKYTEAEK